MYGFHDCSDYVWYSKIKSKQYTRAIQQGSGSLFWPVAKVQNFFLKIWSIFWIFLFLNPPTINWMVLPGWNTEKNSSQSQIGVTELKNGCFDGFFQHFLSIFCYCAAIWHISDIFGIAIADPQWYFLTSIVKLVYAVENSQKIIDHLMRKSIT